MAKKAAVPDSDLEDAQLKRALEERGYLVKKKRVFLKKTLDMDPELLRSINIRRAELNKSLRVVIEEALQDWLKNNPKP